ncbi:uncharacterized protein LOC112688157 [Sipha flava]|uniref:Uncharacterized protein LOC112688157 n=1 Tax=Sipha flava TaxID=143950 RepID=A0A8B8G1Y1_9HEMI|nr:uncharacterized protein LOC112688157 [Sipha flava]
MTCRIKKLAILRIALHWRGRQKECKAFDRLDKEARHLFSVSHKYSSKQSVLLWSMEISREDSVRFSNSDSMPCTRGCEQSTEFNTIKTLACMQPLNHSHERRYKFAA